MHLRLAVITFAASLAGAIQIDANAPSVPHFQPVTGKRADANLQAFFVVHSALAVIAHKADADIASWTCKLCKEDALKHTKDVTVFKGMKRYRAYIGVNLDLKRFVVVFRGLLLTYGDNLQLQDLDMRHKPLFAETAKHGIPYKTGDDRKKLDKMRVHSGFLGLYLLEHQEIIKRIQELHKMEAYKDITTMSIVGHDFGAALANFAAVEFARELPQLKIVLVTFRAPRVGNLDFAKYLTFDLKERVTIYRHVNGNPDIARFPKHILGYAHAGREYYNRALDNVKRIKVCALDPELKQDKTCSKSSGPRDDGDWKFFGRDAFHSGGYVLKNVEQY
jgi:hypothetical protein